MPNASTTVIELLVVTGQPDIARYLVTWTGGRVPLEDAGGGSQEGLAPRDGRRVDEQGQIGIPTDHVVACRRAPGESHSPGWRGSSQPRTYPATAGAGSAFDRAPGRLATSVSRN